MLVCASVAACIRTGQGPRCSGAGSSAGHALQHIRGISCTAQLQELEGLLKRVLGLGVIWNGNSKLGLKLQFLLGSPGRKGGGTCELAV
jgi:hypothetical protein